MGVLFFVQTSVVSKIAPQVTTDLLTTWFLILLVFLSPIKCITIGILTALALETYYTVPQNLYLSAYFILGTLVVLVRNHISWRNLSPWITMFVVGSLWMSFVEMFFILVKSPATTLLSLQYLTTVLLRAGISLGFGLWIVNHQVMKQLKDHKD